MPLAFNPDYYRILKTDENDDQIDNLMEETKDQGDRKRRST